MATEIQTIMIINALMALANGEINHEEMDFIVQLASKEKI